MRVQVAAQVRERHELRQRASGRRLQLAPALAQLGLDPREAELRVDLLLGRAAQRLAGRVVEDAVLRHVQPALHRGLAQRHVVLLRAGEVLEHVAELVGLDDLEVDRHARVGRHARAGVARGVDGLDDRQLCQRPHERGGIGGGGDHVEVLDGVGLAPQRAGDLDPLGARGGAQRVDDLVGDRQRAREQHARRRATVEAGRELLDQLLLDLGAEAAQVAQLLLLGRRPQRLERVDAELVVEPPRALGPEAGQVHHRDQAARELRAQLLGLRRVAGLDQRLELGLERLPDARQFGHAPVAHELRDRHGGLAHRAGRGAVGEHAVLDRAVELVEVGQLLEGGGDLGVRHPP